MDKKITIAIDAMGGDNSPDKIIEGIKFFLSKNSNNNDFVLNVFGKIEEIKIKIKQHNIATDKINLINSNIYKNLNNGVYRCGFATTQKAYQDAFSRLFDCMNDLKSRLSKQRYLLGETITEADWRLFTTLVRFDAVYFSHFKTNKYSIRDSPVLSGYVRDLFQQPGIAETVNIEHIKQHYYYSHLTINPSRVVPEGPELNFSAPHQRHLQFTS